MKYLRMFSDFFLTDSYGAPVFKIVCFWFVGILIFGSVMQSAQKRMRQEIVDREAKVMVAEAKLKKDQAELERERDELQVWNKAITEKAKDREIDKKLKVFKEEIEDYIDPPAR